MGFLAGKSKPRCNELAEIFLQLRLSERSGRGVTKIYDRYGEDVFDINDNFIKVTITFAFERKFGNDYVENKEVPSVVHKTKKSLEVKKRILEEMIRNPKVTTNDLMSITNLGKTSIQKYIKELTESHLIERVGSTKSGYWKVNEE